ncbi:MAG: sensor domain-containing diguanylate cyclase [Terriglobales bacterium]
MEINLATIGVCALALTIFACLQANRHDHGLQGLAGFWAMLLAGSALLALDPRPDSWALRYAGVCAVVAASMLLYIVRRLLAEARPGALDRRWRLAFWLVSLAAVALTLSPPPFTWIGAWLLAPMLAAGIGLLLWAGAPSYRWLAAAVAIWGAALLPHYPDQVRVLAVLAPSLLAWAWLWVAAHRASHAAAHQGAPPEQVHLFRQSVRRSREFEILTHIGTALSSSLDSGALLQAIHTQLHKLMDVRNFYVAFQDLECDCIRFAFEVEDGERIPPRSRPRAQALTEHVIATGQPLLIARDVDLYIRQHGLTASGRPAKNWLGVPVLLQGQPCGVIAVQSKEQEDAFDTEHLRVLEILAGQAGVALDNARLFAEVQRDAGQKSFLNHIARLSISTLSPAQMLSTVVSETAQAFHYDHIAVALLRSAADRDGTQLEIAASAGGHTEAFASVLIPPGRGLAGRAAASGQMQKQTGLHAASSDWARCPQARSGLALPIRYAGETLGVLLLESHAQAGFSPDQVMVLQTLTDQVAVALNHANLFQKLEHQAITDSLTGVKTRRFFMEALQAEWRRARAAGAEGGPASFAIVLVDLDEFKPLNDRFGHLEGDRVLVRVARLLEQKSRASSVVARYGGDEFTILVPACPPELAQLLPERLQAALADDPMLAQRRLNASFGLALFPDSGASPEELLHRADAEMYRSKQQRQHRRAALASP